ncbi:MAG: TatD family hydrolase [bacterium]|nr:TatD family hydrolase [bacterium]
MVDTHCHLDFEPFTYHEEEYLARAKEHGVTSIINPGTSLVTSERAIQLARHYPQVHAAVGLHPTEAKGVDISTVETFRGLAEREQVIAIGEVGLDYYHLEQNPDETASKREQQFIFEQFCSLAYDLKLPLIVHARAAIADALAIVKSYVRDVEVIFHSFDGTYDEAKAIIGIGAYIGINNMITYPKNDDLRQVVKELPLDRFLLETDAPFLPPQERRGGTSEPADVAIVAEAIAEIKNLTLPLIERATNTSVRQIFRIEP